MKLRILASITLALLLLSSCANDYQKVSFNSCKVSSATEFGLSRGKMRATLVYEFNVNNDSKSKFEVVDANALVFDKNGTEFANISLVEPITVLADKNGQSLLVPLEITLFNPMDALLNGSFNVEGTTADIAVNVRQNGLLAKKMERKKVPVKSIMQRFKIIK